MRPTNFTITVTGLTLALSTLANAENKTKIPIVKPAAQREKQNNSAVRSEDKADKQRATELKREEIELLHQAEQKHQQAKALIQKQKALRGEEVSQEHAERGDKKDHRALGGEVKQEASERSQMNREAEQFEKEREALTRQANEKAKERRAIEAQIRANGHKR